MTAADGAIQFDRVEVQFFDRKNGGSITALEDVSFGIGRGEFVSVVGPSGCGKSTLLNLTAGLLAPSRGEVRYDGRAVAGVNTRVGYITQQDNLLPWKSVRKNIELPLRLRGYGPEKIRAVAGHWIATVGLAGFENHFPRQLSGGMKKRASIARTLAYEPETVLLDEPFSALDAQLRIVMQDELLRLWGETAGKSVLFITHDLAEAVALSDRVIVLSGRPGRVIAEFDIPLPRPRAIRALRFTSEFNQLHERIWKAMEQQEH